MNPPSEEILAIIRPHLEKIRQCIMLAWRDFNVECEGIRHKITPTARAAIVRDNMIYHAKILFADVKGVHFIQHGMLFLLIIDDRVCIKFKKLDKNKMPRYIPTQQALFYMNQMEMPEIIPRASKWVAGYLLDKLQTSIENIFITYPVEARTIPWHLELSPVTEKITPQSEKEEQKEEIRL